MKKIATAIVLVLLIGVSGFFIVQTLKNRGAQDNQGTTGDNKPVFNPLANDCPAKAAQFGFDKKPCTGNECNEFCSTYPECCPKEGPKVDNSTKIGRQASTEEQKSAPPVIKNLGVNFAPYDSSTNKAGDFSFAASPAYGKILGEFGQIVGGKKLPHYTYYLPENTPIMAVADGDVVAVWYQEQTNDYEIHVKPAYDSYWDINYDHVTNPAVKENGTIKAGDIIAYAGDFVEISLESEKQKPGTFYPLLSYFDPSLKQQYEKAIWTLLSDWETYKNNENIYNEESMAACPACLSSSLPDSYS